MHTKGVLVLVLVSIILISGCIQQTSKGQYSDVAFSDLSSTHSGRSICLYGDYSTGFEHSGFGDVVWVERAGSFGDFILPKKEQRRDSNNYGNTIACGYIEYSPNGVGHLNRYSYLLNAQIVTDAPDEYPYKSQIKTSEDCQKISGSKRKDICYWKYGIDEKNTQFCGAINDKIIRSTCIWHVAEALKNPALCKTIDASVNMSSLGSDERLLKDVCIRQSISTEPSACEDISNTDLKNGCYYTVAYGTSNPELCAKMEREEGKVNLRGDCYGDLAYKLDNLSMCETLDEWDRDACYWDYAGITKNYEHCDKIVREPLRESCPSHSKSLSK